MRPIVFALILLTFSVKLFAQNATVIKSPAELPKEDRRPKVFLGGSIDMGRAENQQGFQRKDL